MMAGYSEEEILDGLRKQGTLSAAGAGLALAYIREAAMKKKESHVHDFADWDMITVKEIRDAQDRLREPGYPSTVFSAEKLLRSISENRRPEYPYGTVWKDNSGIYWFRCDGNQ